MGTTIKFGMSLSNAFGPSVAAPSAYNLAASNLRPRLWLDMADMRDHPVTGAGRQLVTCRASGTLFDSNLGTQITYANSVNGKKYAEFRGTHILRTGDPGPFAFPGGEEWGIFMVTRNILDDNTARLILGPDLALSVGDATALHLGYAIDGTRPGLFSNTMAATLVYSGTQVEYPPASGLFQPIVLPQNEWHATWIGFDTARGVQVMRNGVTAAEGLATVNTLYTAPMLSAPIRIGDFAGNGAAAKRAHFDMQTLMILDRNPFSLSMAPARIAFNQLQAAQWGIAMQGGG